MYDLRGGRTRRLGFTLVELVVVILIFAVLTLIIIPRVVNAGRRAKETQLRGDLKHLRDAVERFQARTNALPPTLKDLLAPNGAAVSADTDATGASVDRDAYDGPYLEANHGQLPDDPFTGKPDWDYSQETGAVHSSSRLTGLDHTPYSTW